jgi:hypothetical protein
MTSASQSLPVATIAEYSLAIEEFDRLWETGTTQEQQQRMADLLIQIELFEMTRRELAIRLATNRRVSK